MVFSWEDSCVCSKCLAQVTRRTRRETYINPLGRGKQTRSPEIIGSMGEKKEDGRGRGGEKGREEENMRKKNAQEEGRTERKRKERATLIEGAIKGLVRNMVLGKFPGIQKDDPS